MTTPPLDVLPAERREAARNALTAAFGRAPIEALASVAGGASGALTYRADVGGRPYLLRLETRRDVFRNPIQYACMQTAADAGIAPPVRHVDDAAGVAIIDFLPQRPLTDYPGGPPALAAAMGELVARLHATPTFGFVRDYPTVLRTMLAVLRHSRLFAPGLLDPHHEGLERICEAYPWDAAARVSSHNDPNPRNIIFDGQRLWLIDWESAFRNDPLVDIAILTHEIAPTPELESVLLRAWLGRAPDRAIHARLVLMRGMTQLFYAGAVLTAFAAQPPATPDTDLAAPTWVEFGEGIASGRWVLGAPQTSYLLGKMFLAGYRASLSAPGFEEALVITRQG